MSRHLVYFDLETQYLLQEVGGRANIPKLRVACAVTWSYIHRDFKVYWEKNVTDLLEDLISADYVVGFNIIQFDFEVLKPYFSDGQVQSIVAKDMLEDLRNVLGFRVSLDSVSEATLGMTKNADGIQSVQWFRQGKLEQVAEYCKQDVEITRRIYEYGCENGYVNILSKYGKRPQRVKINWSLD